MSVSLLLKGGLVLDPAANLEKVLDVRISGGDIVEIGENLKADSSFDVVDAAGAWICPGFIDIHTHLRDFGQSDREDIATGTMAAAAGGYTTVTAMANTDPPIDNTAILTVLLKKIDERAHIEVLPIACVTKQQAGVELTNMVDLADLGAAAFSDDGIPITNLAVLRRALEYARLADRLIISHAEDKDLIGKGVITEGLVSTKLGLPGSPAAAEAAAVAREIEVVRHTQGRLHFAHISFAQSVNLIRQARKDGLAVTADVTPHHLTLTVEHICSYDTNYKMNPPLRHESDIKALIAGLQDGTIAAIATDHAPHTKMEKDRPFDCANVGLIGLETAFAVSQQKLVAEKHLSKLEFIKLLTTGPAQVMNLPQPGIGTGQRADLAIVDPNVRWLYDASKGYSRSSNSPYSGQTLTGKNLLTIYQGSVVYKDKDLIGTRSKAGCPSS